MRRLVIGLLSGLLSSWVSAYSVSFDTVVDGRDNLYYTDWGHPYTETDVRNPALANPGSNPASAVQYNGSYFDFASFDTVSLWATGFVIDDDLAGSGPDGWAADAGADPFRGLPVYSLIGIWSSSATEILPLTGWDDPASGFGPFFIGSALDLVVPDFSSVYLFLAENDGAFIDNSGVYNVKVTASVPEPGSLALLAIGMVGLGLARRWVS